MKLIKDEELKKIAHELRNGKLVLFPTETVYGIGTNGLDEKAVKKKYEVKKRSLKNPINLLVRDISMVEEIATNISPLEYKLMEAFFPGPFTLILKKKTIVPSIVTAGSDTVGVRMPDNEICQKLLTYSGVPIAAPSANISGTPSGTALNDILKDFSGKIDYVINGGKTDLGIESTIVKVINNIPYILRPGSITAEQIKEVAGNVMIENVDLPSNNLKHYQLNCPSLLVYCKDSKKMSEQIMDLAKKHKNPVVLAYNENLKNYSSNLVIDLGPSKNLIEVSKCLFENLRKTQLLNPDYIFIEGLPKTGLGLAIMNRFLQVCNQNYLEILM